MLRFLSREDYLNYRIVMEGFYYDAAIEHIIEIVKNSIYFAIISGDCPKVIKNTHDTCYFNVDDELVYANYYYDFGPLNISCLYKYCCKLNSYLQYAQGLKRIVHYTTSHPINRVNAAFLIGSYTIIYLKKDPKEIYHLLLNTGGPFKPYVDASQGISQYSIRLLDCLYAVQKAIVFNFVNFDDFNVMEYDARDKLQNGDMNWLLPRKFLAFIGPTDSEIMNGHPPNFYIKYFLDNDVKTIVRLNNKVYNAEAFVNAGIDHYELFFPDGSVPSKQILIRFLDLSENSRAAVAVHCKAGLGRTGSLIGAYIIKHYHLTAREAIAWMRICRPGSVIGQQQGWLERIESWLWRQGSQYRLQHFGDGDKIPHHRYGIYSYLWPNEREKIIKQVQRRKLSEDTNAPRIRSGIENPTRYENLKLAKHPIRSAVTPKKTSVRSHSYVPKPVESRGKNEDEQVLSTLLGKIHSNVHNRNYVPEIKEIYKMQDTNSMNNCQCEDQISNSSAKLKRESHISRFKENCEILEENQKRIASDVNSKRYGNSVPIYDRYESEGRSRAQFNDDCREPRPPSVKPRRRSKEEPGESNMDTRTRQHIREHLIMTQGDKLNEIKANRLASKDNKINKPRKLLSNVTNVGSYNKAKATTSKKQEMETILPIKKSQFEQHLYS